MLLLIFVPAICWGRSSPDFIEIDLREVRPTQSTVGQAEVDRIAHEIAKMSTVEREEFIREITPEVVLGPEGVYILDRHHHFSALLKLGIFKAYGQVIKDYSDKSDKKFAEKMMDKELVFLKNINNRTIAFRNLPKTLMGLIDDPYLSLTSDLKRAGGFRKEDVFYLKLFWAERLRRIVPLQVLLEDPFKALRISLEYARSPKSAELPGSRTNKNLLCRRAHVTSYRFFTN